MGNFGGCAAMARLFRRVKSDLSYRLRPRKIANTSDSIYDASQRVYHYSRAQKDVQWKGISEARISEAHRYAKSPDQSPDSYG